jgi:hypothetical protein
MLDAQHIGEILKTLTEVCDVGDKYKHPFTKELRELGRELQTCIDDRQQQVMLTHIRKFLSGGMGGFNDFRLTPVEDSKITYAELNVGFGKIVGHLYEQVSQALQQLG